MFRFPHTEFYGKKVLGRGLLSPWWNTRVGGRRRELLNHCSWGRFSPPRNLAQDSPSPASRMSIWQILGLCSSADAEDGQLLSWIKWIILSAVILAWWDCKQMNGFVCLFACVLFLCLFVCVCVYLFTCFYVCFRLFLYVCLYLFVCVFVSTLYVLRSNHN